MSELTHNNQELVQYLLGTLSAADTERLDELSFTDNKFADSLKAAEKDLVDAYVQHELAADELKQFKSLYLASQPGREKIELAETFQRWFEISATAPAERIRPEGTERHVRAVWFSGLRTFAIRPFAWQWGLAAVTLLLLLVAGGLLVFQNLRLRQRVTQAEASQSESRQREKELQKEIEARRSAGVQTEQELARVRDEQERLEQELQKRSPQSPVGGNVVSLILTAPMRGAGQVPTVSIAPGINLVATQLELEPSDFSAFRVALIDSVNNQTLWRSGNLKPRTRGERKSIAVSLPANLLKPQNYILRVTGIPGSGVSEIVGDYAFRVVK